MHKREQGELRQMGGMAIINRTFQDKNQVLLIKDQAKVETASGFSGWFPARGEVLSFPGGGRGIKKNSYPENLAQTLASELKEEIGLTVKLLDTQLQRQAFPFLVGQLTDTKIDEFAVTSAYLPFDSLPIETRKNIDQVTQQKQAQWENLFSLFHLFSNIKELFPEGTSLFTLRPQVLVASYIWFLDAVQHVPAEDIQRRIEPLNRMTHTFIYDQAQKHQIPVNNGFFNAQGQINRPLNFRDQRFIFGQNQK